MNVDKKGRVNLSVSNFEIFQGLGDFFLLSGSLVDEFGDFFSLFLSTFNVHLTL